MFDTLVESNKRGRRDITGTMLGVFASTTVQAVVVMGAVYATMGAPREEPLPSGDTIILLPPDPGRRQQPEDEPPVRPLTPLPIGFQTPDLPMEIPHGIPPVDLAIPFDVRNYTGTGVEKGVFDGVVGISAAVDPVAGLYRAGVVDEEPERVSCPTLEYPPLMRQAGIEGQVLLQFVVAADGHVEPATVEVLGASHRGFEQPARHMISRCRFRSGRVGANAVRVLAQMPIVFSLRGSR